jgi:hypothetical protein
MPLRWSRRTLTGRRHAFRNRRIANVCRFRLPRGWNRLSCSFATSIGPLFASDGTTRCVSSPVGCAADLVRRMAYREVSVIEVKEVLRLWLAAQSLREVATLAEG